MKDKLLIHSNDKEIIELNILQNDIIRLRCYNTEEIKEEETFVVEKSPTLTEFNVAESNTSKTIITNSNLKITINLAPFSIEVYSNKGKKIFSTPLLNTTQYKENMSIFRINLSPDEKIYGLGQDPMANLNQKDKERRMWNEWSCNRRSGNGGIPFYMSSTGYGLLLNSSYPSRFAIGKAEVAEPSSNPERALAPWSWSQDSGEINKDDLSILLDNDILDIFIICRESYDEIQNGYVDLTGHAPMLPKWALGFIQCKNRYRTQEELLYIAKQYRRKQIPCDVLVLDWLWFKEFGDLEWFKENWPDPQGMLEELKNMGFHIMQAQHPYIDRISLKYNYFNDKGFLNDTPKNGRPTYDHSNPDARKEWWKEIKKLYEDGIRGYWTDMGEIEDHPVGTKSYLGSREKVHNIYSLLWNKGLYEGQRKDYNERVFNLPRTTYAGIQRYGSALWSGDIDASWEVLKDQVVIGQGVCLSGQQYWCTDIGGFFIDERFNDELYIRWFQWGTFCPIFRTHGTRPDNEAWAFGKQAEKIVTKFIKLRYRLMPYIYSCARKVTEHGTPIMRAMCMDYANDPIAVEQTTQFMFGPSILVAPIVKEGARERKVYLPKGIWYDFWTNEKFDGNQWITALAPLDHIPLYVKAGSIIPMSPILQYVNEKPLETIEIHAYVGDNGCFELYEDDGLTYDYEKGNYYKTLIVLDKSGNIAIKKLEGNDELIPVNRKYEEIIHKENTDKKKTVTVYTDCCLKTNGHCLITALIINHLKNDTKIKASIKLPAGWVLTSNSSQTIESTVNNHEILKWETISTADVQPVIHEGLISLETIDSNIEKSTYPINWGSGYATHWSLIGPFNNTNEKGLDNCYEPENNPNAPYYNNDSNSVFWNSNTSQYFNCFGYVSMPLPKPSLIKDRMMINGINYAKCKIWSEEKLTCYLQLSADPSIKLWINGNMIFRRDTILLNQIIDESIQLEKGWNDILVKLAISDEKPYGGREYGFNFRIVDKDGNILNNLLYKA